MAIRILHVVTYMGRGGLETMLMNYYRHIDRNKVQFDFLVHRDFEADYDAEILKMGGRIYHVSRLIPWSRSYKEELKKFFQSHPEYKIVHVHQDCLSSVALQCAKECGISVRVAHSHSSSAVKDWKYFIKSYYMKQISKYATELFACGKKAGNWMFCGDSFRILRNAIDTQKYCYLRKEDLRLREELGLAEEIVIGHVGNFTVAKNHGFLLEIFQKIVKCEPAARLLLVGDGDHRQEIEEKVAELSLKENVFFMGVRKDVAQLMQVMDVFVFPSLYEGVPVTMIEAQAAGLPCVISDQVSEECIVTKDLVTIMKLSDSAERWAQHILTRMKIPKTDHKEEIQECGYDIRIEAPKLEAYYLDKYREQS